MPGMSAPLLRLQGIATTARLHPFNTQVTPGAVLRAGIRTSKPCQRPLDVALGIDLFQGGMELVEGVEVGLG